MSDPGAAKQHGAARPQREHNRRAVLRYEEHWPDLMSQLASDRQRGLSPSGARDLLTTLLDDGTFVEVGTLVRRQTQSYEEGAENEISRLEQGTDAQLVPGDAVVAGWGTIDGRQVFVAADDTEIGGPLRGPGGAGKVTRIRDLALRQGKPIVQVLESVRVGPDQFIGADFAQVGYGVDFPYETNAARQIPKVSIVHGALHAQAAFEAVSAHLTILAGPDARATLSRADQAGSDEQCAQGIADYAVDSPYDALPLVKRFLSYLPSNCWEPSPLAPARPPRLPDVDTVASSWESRRLIDHVCDGGDLFEIRPAFAPNLVAGLGRINGRTAGIIAIDAVDARIAEKLARIVSICDIFRLPVVYLVGSLALPEGEQLLNSMLALRKALAVVRRCTAPQVFVLTRPVETISELGAHATFIGQWSTAKRGGEVKADLVFEPRETKNVLSRVLQRAQVRTVPPWFDPRVNRGRPKRRAPGG